jgi:hypothetical protein
MKLIDDILTCETKDLDKIDARIKMLQTEREYINQKCDIPSFTERMQRFFILCKKKHNNPYNWRQVGKTYEELWTQTAAINWDSC